MDQQNNSYHADERYLETFHAAVMSFTLVYIGYAVLTMIGAVV